MKIKISAGCPRGSVSAPPSKSYAHRMLLCAALAKGESVIRGIAENEDILATLDCVRALGAKCTVSGDTVTVSGIGAAAVQNGNTLTVPDISGIFGQSLASPSEEALTFPCRESGSTMRFFIPVSLVFGQKAEFVGSKRLMKRGIDVYERLFAEKGIACQNNGEGVSFFGRLIAGEYVLPGDVSSQFISGLLFALPLLNGDSMIKVLPPVESRGYIDITLDVMRKFGVCVTETEKNTFYVKGGQSYECRDYTVEGDWSNGAALIALGEITKEKRLIDASEIKSEAEIKVLGLNENSLQGDKVCVKLFEKLRAGDVAIDISDCPDLGPVLFAVAAAWGGGSFVGTRRLKIKESDRAHAMAEELKKFGIPVTVEENSVTVHRGVLTSPSVSCQSHNDHRIVMALSLLGALVGCEIEGAEAITKSYPNFFDVLDSLGLNVEKA